MTGLAASGFLKTTELDREVEECATAHITRKQHIMMLAMRLLDWKITFNNVDGYLEKIYRKCIWVAFTRAAQVIFALISLCGLALLLLHSDASIYNNAFHQCQGLVTCDPTHIACYRFA